MDARLTLVSESRYHRGLRGPQADPWRTVSGWAWVAYLAGLASVVWTFL